MRILAISFLFLTTFSITHATHNVCPTSNCAALPISYPFKLQHSQTENDCSYVDLRCSGAATVINLPDAGDFYVRNISYDYPYIQLYDPGNCLITRLINDIFGLSPSSPLKAFAGGTYAFYTCPVPTDIRDGLYLIDCLSNTTNVTVAMDFPPSLDMKGTGCQEIGSWPLPVPSNRFNDDLYLTWDSTSCPACAADTDDGNSWGGFSGSPYFSSTFVVIAVVVTTCSFLVTRKIVGRPNAADGLPVSGLAMATPPQAICGSLEESEIDSCTKLMVLSESIVDSGSDSHICSICLESFQPQELVRSIVLCEHCFHAECILTWLIKSRTCPVCRISFLTHDICFLQFWHFD